MKQTTIPPAQRDFLTDGGDEQWLKERFDALVPQRYPSYVFVDMNIKRFQYINNKHGRKRASLRNCFSVFKG